MIKNYLRSALRSIKHHRSFSVLNIFGLSLGMCCSILIFLWVADEMSFDKFNANAKNIYRVTSNITDSKAAVIPVPMGIAIKSALPAVANVTRMKATGGLFTIGNKKFEEKNGYYTDSNFLRMFSYPLIAGNMPAVLNNPDGIVITESAAKKYFGTTDAVGKTLVDDNDIKSVALTVTGVLKDIPANSHLLFEFLLPLSLYEKTIDYDGSWGNFDVYTYVQMDKSFQPSPVGIQRFNQQLYDLYLQSTKDHATGDFTMQPLTDIHLSSNHLLLGVKGGGNMEYVRIFALIAVFIIIIACINFMNLSTAMASQRAKEVGLRKTIGALRSQLVAQFLGESVLLSCISLCIAAILASLLLPFFNTLTAKNISFSVFNTQTILLLPAAAVVIGLLAGSYPALFLSSFTPIKVLKGIKALPGQRNFFRNGLVVVQFSISIVLIIGTLVVYNQLQYIRNRDIGFNKENLMYIKMPQTGDLGNNFQALKASLNQYPGISDYTIINYLPTNLTTGTDDVIWPGKDPHLAVIFPHLGVDENFAKTFGMHVIAGRFFEKDFPGDNRNYVINETALKIMKMDAASAIGKEITFNGRKGDIIGVLKDFNFKPIQKAVEPLVIRLNGSGGNLVVRTTPAEIKNILAQVKNVFRDVYADYPFSYGFVDEELSKLYISEQQMGKLFNVFAILSVIVSGLGLFGLSAYAAQRRIKEIGVRKVLGASVTGIVSMLSKDFIKPVFIAALIAFPAAWWIMNQWLQGFAYRIVINWWIFAAAGIIALVIAFATVSYQAIKAALANPVDSLRNE